MFTTPSPVEASTLGATAPECEDCEGSGTVTYLHGPYAHTRECDTCRGTGRCFPCPACTDGTSPATGEACTTCDGFAALT